jgi:murein DD-endopeptidase MepM/ murein hydrolase activator NlpD
MSGGGRRGTPVLAAGLGGFVLGAATVMLVVWMAGLPGAGGAGAPPPNAPPSGRGSATGGPPGALAPGAGAAPNGAAAPASPPPAASGGDAATPDEIADLSRRHLLLPVQGVRREELRDSFDDARTGHVHEALDIMAPRGTAVLAVEDGRLVKLFYSRQGGNTLYQFDPGQTYAYYYAHLDRYAPGLREGDALSRGQVIGYVGSSGNASPEAPHLHFAIFVLNPDRHWWQGRAINPFRVFALP